MGSHQFAAQDRQRTLFARFAEAGAWILACLVPAAFLARLFGLTFYAIPESDDFCLSYLNATSGFVETTRIWYLSAVGRVVPLLLIQIPNAISDASGIDYFLSYTATLAAFEICFAAAVMLVAFRLWPQAKPWQNVFMAAALLATILTRLPSLREMLYWLPGVACYTLPGAIVAIVLVEFARAAEDDTQIGPRTTFMLAIASFVASLCNEFTPAWLIGLLLCSLIFRAMFRQNLQVGTHAIIGVVALLGFLIMLFASGNAVRMAQFPLAGDIKRSISEAYVHSRSYFRLLFLGWPAWLAVVAIFSASQPEAVKGSSKKRLLLAVLVPIFCLACGYLAHFVAQYSTGSVLATRAQNQVIMLLVVGSTIGVAALSRAVRFAMSFPVASRKSYSTGTAILLGTLLVLPLYNSTTMKLLRSERDSLRIFWLESMARHAQLSLSTEADIMVAKHSALPSALSGEDVHDDPGRLPNDCIARFYGKRTVKLAIPKETVADVLPLIATLIREVRAKQGASQGQDLTPPSILRRGQNLSPLLGRIVLTRSVGASMLDFYSLPTNVCRELLFEVSKLEGVLRVAGSGRSADEKIAPIGRDVSERSCSEDGTFARVILDTAP
jgi:hypothetical protein